MHKYKQKVAGSRKNVFLYTFHYCELHSSFMVSSMQKLSNLVRHWKNWKKFMPHFYRSQCPLYHATASLCSGVFGPCLTAYEKMDVKHIQHDSLG